ncbi:precorrin-6y C5,15-methyltransferase (decarboxylating) subunit CbiE [Petrocella atlantisensis]|nr:precorrin-6y C5,15-methyltransferase (decarboxylating) subunit CbiE [Petrocella atlantisensis]
MMINVVGIGPGKASGLTIEAQDRIKKGQCVIGTKRQLASTGMNIIKPIVYSGRMEDLEAKIKEQLILNQSDEVVVLASGDPSIYGLSKCLMDLFGKDAVHVTAGISAIQYLFARIKLDMNDLYITSAHGKRPDFDLLFKMPKVALVTDGSIGPYEIGQEAILRGFNPRMIIGENLSYDDESIQETDAKTITRKKYEMNVVILLNDGSRLY